MHFTLNLNAMTFYQQTCWNDVLCQTKTWEFMLCHNVEHHLGQSEDWIFWVSLVTRTCNVWRNELSRQFVGHWTSFQEVCQYVNYAWMKICVWCSYCLTKLLATQIKSCCLYFFNKALIKSYFKISTFQPNFLCSSYFKGWSFRNKLTVTNIWYQPSLSF